MRSLYFLTAFLILFVGCSLFGLTISFGQSIAKTTLFKKQSLEELRKQNQAPRQSTFQTVTLTPAYHNPLARDHSIEQQNRIMLAQHGMLPGQNQNRKQKEYDEIRQELRQDKIKEQQAQFIVAQRSFQNSYQEFSKLNPDSFSVTKAIYLAESAWYDNPPSFQEFEKAIQSNADLVRLILKNEALDSRNNIALNYAIQKLYNSNNQFINQKTKKIVTVPKLGYDFDDFMGEKNWSNMFVAKLLLTGKGQCHSLPLLYLAIAEKLGAKAYLSLSPEHSFIQFFDKKGYRYNFETTNGNLVTQAWLMQSTFVNATALKNRTYLDTLSSKQLYAQLLSDLLQNYTNKLGYDEVAMQMAGKILYLDPKNIAALMTQANYNTFIAKDKLKEAGYPALEQLPHFPEAAKAYQNMLKSYELIEQTGFQEMPKEDYQRWLKTIEQEKKKQKTIEMQQQMKQQVEKVKKAKVSTTNKTNHK